MNLENRLTQELAASSVGGATVRPQEAAAVEGYKSYARRLLTFATWPLTSVVSPQSLARAGFYYLRRSDMVKCVYCHGVVRQWERGDDPDQEHRIHFPNCDFYIKCNQEEEEMSTGEKLEISNVKLMPGTTADLSELGIQPHSAPKQQKCATYETRFRTFQEWPKHLNQTPEMLAKAGFYYVGFEDQVRCFHCDGGLRNWEATDDAWVEHARWFPKCGYLSLVQGPQFIKKCLENRPPVDSSISINTPSTSVPAPPSTSHVREVTNLELEQLLGTTPAMVALQIGLHVGRVKMALKKKLEETGAPHVSEDELIEDVLRMQFYEDSNSSSTENRTLDSLSSEFTPLLNQMNDERMPKYSRSKKEKVQNVEEMESGKSDEETSRTEQDKRELTVAVSVETVSLEEEIRRLKEARLCKVCMDCEVAVVFLPCGHLVTCVHCAPSLSHCPMCRQDIRATVRTFLA